jgi:hypothetical protein
VFGTVPDVTQVPYLVDAQTLMRFTGSDYGLAPGHYTTLLTMIVLRFGLDDGTMLSDPNTVLSPDELATIAERADRFNDKIREVADALDAPVVDINELFDDVAQNPPIVFGVPLTGEFLGGFFSLDGVHPSGIGHALVADRFIERMNEHYGWFIPRLNIFDWYVVLTTDPHMDWDQDDRVAGRTQAGLLEALAPFLGLAGDIEFEGDVNAPFQALDADRFIDRYVELTGEDLRTQFPEAADAVPAILERLFSIRDDAPRKRPLGY